MTVPTRAILTSIAILASWAGGVAQSSSSVLFHGGRFLSNDGKNTVHEAVLQTDGKIVAVGTWDELNTRPESVGATRVDLHGATAVPGLQDAHGHLESYSRSLVELDLTGSTSYEDVISRVKARAATLPDGAWIRGRGWDQNLWIDSDFPHHFLLSTAVPRHPVFLTRVDGHAALVNLPALVLAGLDGSLEPPPKVLGGRVLVDEAHHASGILLDAAMELVERTIPAEDAATRASRFLTAQDTLLARGLTCVHDMGTTRATLDMLESLRAKGLLRLRVVAYLDGQGDWKSDPFVGLPMAPDPADLLSVPGVRLMADGALGSRGAALIDDYADAPGERGQLLLSEEELSTRVARIARAGLQPAVHAIGDRANRVVLDAYERMRIAVDGFADRRPRIEEAQVVAPKDWVRFPDLGVIPSMQPSHATSELPWVRARLGEQRTRGAYAWRALAPELGRLAFGSDFPYESPDPLRGLYAARTRQNPSAKRSTLPPGQTLDGAAALAGFTSGAAYASFQENRRGRLLPGFACDLTVLSVDPVACDPKDLLQAKVLMTVVNGVIVWRAR